MLMQIQEMQEPASVQDEDYHKEEEQSQSSPTNAESSSSTPTSTLVRMRNLSKIYGSCNFGVVEP